MRALGLWDTVNWIRIATGRPKSNVVIYRNEDGVAAREIVSTGEGRTPDFKINGVPHELKTVRCIQSPTSEGVSKTISKTILRGRGQARNVIIDARKQPGMTIAIAERSIGRAFGADVKRGLESVTILTNSGPVYVLRSIRK